MSVTAVIGLGFAAGCAVAFAVLGLMMGYSSLCRAYEEI